MLKDLVAQFGLDERGVQSYLDHANDHQYTLVKAPLTRKGEIIAEWFRVSRQIKDPATPSMRLANLHQKRERLVVEMTRLEQNVLGDPEALWIDVADRGRTA